MKMLFAFILLAMQAQSQIFDQERRPDWISAGVGGNFRSPDETDKSSLTLDAEVSAVVWEGKDEHQNHAGYFQLSKFKIEVDIFGAQSSGETGSIDVRSLAWSAFNYFYSPTNAILGFKANVLDIVTRKYDNQFKHSSMDLFTGQIHLKPFNRTQSPVKLIIYGEIRMMGGSFTRSADPNRESKILAAVQGTEDWDLHARTVGHVPLTFFNTPNKGYGIQASYKNLFQIGSKVEHRMSGARFFYYDGLTRDKEGIGGDGYDDRIEYDYKNVTHDLRVPLKKFFGLKGELIGRYSTVRTDVSTALRDPRCGVEKECKGSALVGGNAPRQRDRVVVPFETRKNNTAYVGLRFRFK